MYVPTDFEGKYFAFRHNPSIVCLLKHEKLLLGYLWPTHLAARLAITRIIVMFNNKGLQFVVCVCEQQKHRPACASTQSALRLCYSLHVCLQNILLKLE